MSETVHEAQRESEVQRSRAKRLEKQVAELERRLVEAEQAHAADAGEVARLRARLADLESEQATIVARLTRPLSRAERAIGWLAEKAGKVLGMIARHLVFRRRGEG